MKRLISPCLAVALLVVGMSVSVRADVGASEVDFGKFTETDKSAKYVEINLGQNLLSLAARLMEKHQPEAAKLLRSVHLVRVNVLGLTDENRSDAARRVHGIRAQLEKEGWVRIITVQEKNGQDVGIFIQARGDEALEGVVVTALDGKKKEAVFINIVGDIKPEQIADLGEALHIEQLKKAGAEAKKK